MGCASPGWGAPHDPISIYEEQQVTIPKPIAKDFEAYKAIPIVVAAYHPDKGWEQATAPFHHPTVSFLKMLNRDWGHTKVHVQHPTDASSLRTYTIKEVI